MLCKPCVRLSSCVRKGKSHLKEKRKRKKRVVTVGRLSVINLPSTSLFFVVCKSTNPYPFSVKLRQMLAEFFGKVCEPTVSCMRRKAVANLIFYYFSFSDIDSPQVKQGNNTAFRLRDWRS